MVIAHCDTLKGVHRLCTPLRVSQQQKSKIYFIYALETLNKYLSYGPTKNMIFLLFVSQKNIYIFIEK